MRSLRTRALRSSADAEARRAKASISPISRALRVAAAEARKKCSTSLRAPAGRRSSKTHAERKQQDDDDDEQPRQRGFGRARCEGALQIAQKRLEPLHRGFPQIPVKAPLQAGLGLEGRVAEPGASTPPKLGGPIAPFKNFVISQLVLR